MNQFSFNLVVYLHLKSPSIPKEEEKIVLHVILSKDKRNNFKRINPHFNTTLR
jgi:hypothetical protein